MMCNIGYKFQKSQQLADSILVSPPYAPLHDGAPTAWTPDTALTVSDRFVGVFFVNNVLRFDGHVYDGGTGTIFKSEVCV